MVVDVGQVLDVNPNVDRCQGVVWEGIPENYLVLLLSNHIGTAKKSEESLYICQQYELAGYWKKANLETVWK